MNKPHRHALAVVTAIILVTSGAYAQDNRNNGVSGSAKPRLGIKAGLNFLSLPKVKSPNQTVESSTGFFAGAYYAVPAKRLGYRTELIFSRQGYNYKTSSQTGDVMLNCLVLPQLMTLNITRFVQLHAGGQVAFLLNAKVDSSANPSSVPNLEKANNYFSKVNYGIAGGAQVHPVAGLFVGARYNLFFNMLADDKTATTPPYVPATSNNLKNGLFQFYLGYQF